MGMISFTESDGNGMNITVLYRKDKWGVLNPICELIEVDKEWHIDTDSELFIVENPQGDKHEYLNTMFGIGESPIDRDKSIMSFKSGFLNFDVKSPQPARGGTDVAEVRLRMAESLKQAVGYIEQGQIRLGPEVRSPLGCG